MASAVAVTFNSTPVVSFNPLHRNCYTAIAHFISAQLPY
jgi:hypothetical protein